MKTVKFRGKDYLVLTRKKGKETEICPFCGIGHIHGNSDGHRVAHCADTLNRKDFAVINGYLVKRTDGYFIETI
jgi:hypothetical protein